MNLFVPCMGVGVGVGGGGGVYIRGMQSRVWCMVVIQLYIVHVWGVGGAREQSITSTLYQRSRHPPTLLRREGSRERVGHLVCLQL